MCEIVHILEKLTKNIYHDGLVGLHNATLMYGGASRH